MSTGSSSALLVVLLACAAAVLAGAGVAATGPGPQQVTADDREATTMVVELRANGNARWTVSTTFNLSTQNETEAYRELAADFENGETSALGLPAYRTASSLASNVTGREMQITNETRLSAPRSMVVNGTGRLTLQFTWENFGRVETRNLEIGDAFRTEDGLWLPGLNRGQTLVIKPPDGYGVVNANVQPDNGTLRWTGPATFDRETLEATFIGTGNGNNGSGNATTPTRTATPGGNGGQSSNGLLWLGLVVLGVGTIALVGYLVVQQDGLTVPGTTDGPDAGAAAEETTDTEAETPGSETTQTAAATASAETEQTDDTDDDAIDEELLSDEERVERLLEENGGRMKQANIVKETGWSNAKVSQLLSAMAEEDRIDKLRIGRENLISFPDEDITEIDE